METTSRPHPLVGAILLAVVGAAAVIAARSVPMEPVESTPPTPAPAAVPAEPAVAPAALHGATPDDPPRLTRSGRVEVSRDPDRPPALGPAAAKVTIVVYSEFTCPVCRRSAPATRQIVEEWPGDVRLEFRQFASPSHQNAENTSAASLAAQRQGKFWEMHDALFASQSTLTESTIPAVAAQVGLDMDRFAKDFADPAIRRRVQDETAQAMRVGAVATPSFLVNGRVTVGWASWLGFRTLVEQERDAVDALLASGVPLRDVHARRAREAMHDDAVFETYRTAVIEPLARR
jgi:protein-disulfide isomerase